MTGPRIPQFRTRVSREGVVSSRNSFNRRVEAPIDTANYQQDTEDSKLDRLDIERTTDGAIDEASALRDRLVAVGPLGCVAYLHVRLAEGVPTTLAAFNTRLGEMAAQLPILLLTDIEEPYIAVVHNQRSGDNDIYHVDDRLARTLTIRAIDTAAGVVALNVDEHEFVLIGYQLLSEDF